MSVRRRVGASMARVLFNYTAGLPCRRIDRAVGQRYLERYYLGECWGRTFYLHRFVDADHDEETHDHPFNATALCLAGSYVEERLVSADAGAPGCEKMRVKTVRPGSVNVIKGGGLGVGDFHRIIHAEPETWTLFVVGKRLSSWGFFRALADGFHYVHYKAAIKHIPEPFEGAYLVDWPTRAPLGRDADRAPFGGAGSA
ncbi:hypothetical protein [uncultured Zhongshania sp.]|uniref:hypothetical protein n=1 Tax=uncultured Zhongshania sp. TaxID=1642288 RepID=UPI0030DB167E